MWGAEMREIDYAFRVCVVLVIATLLMFVLSQIQACRVAALERRIEALEGR